MTDTPAYRDANALREAYESADTLLEASEEFDASYDTVRRWMIEHGIHEPETRDHYACSSRFGGESA